MYVLTYVHTNVAEMYMYSATYTCIYMHWPSLSVCVCVCVCREVGEGAVKSRPKVMELDVASASGERVEEKTTVGLVLMEAIEITSNGVCVCVCASTHNHMH